MDGLDQAIHELESSHSARFDKLVAVCTRFFGEPRVRGSHHIFKTPWPGDPRVNLQSSQGGAAKPYQIKQVLQALRRLKDQS
jgi:hypothetical protein